MKASPIPRYKEHECYAFAVNMRSALGKRPKKAATEGYLATHVSKPIKLQPWEVRLVARFYFRSFALEPFGETNRIHLR